MTTVNGKILGANWGADAKTYSGIYEKCHNTFKSEAWMCGRATMEKDFADEQPVLIGSNIPVVREAFIGDKTASSFAIAVDGKGKLGWKSNQIGGDHIIEILTEDVSDACLHYLQRKDISYIFAGKTDIDLASALQQLVKLFPVKTIMLEGGGYLNGSMLNEGLVDELSILVLPIADITPNTITAFELSDHLPKKETAVLTVKDVRQLQNDVLWLTYRVSRK